MIRFQEVPHTTYHPEWRNLAEGWTVTISVFDDTDPGRRHNGNGVVAWYGSSVVTIDEALITGRSERLQQLALAKEASGYCRDESDAFNREYAEAGMKFLRHVAAQLAAADPGVFGPLGDLSDARFEAYAKCVVCPCTPGVVLGFRWYYQHGIQYDLDIAVARD